ncbi:hypothetical protein GUJ93_ZPchr0010g9348 [Zizania palustris]|uniref:Uncharacterized protein n=1 Tax=Zizania palustris TaxID=103762 RepID=A0A8J5W7M3_ZIZPA|nr:hypothetical protein GUJ93_ZPchr0010g9348 [Zizania palustris]
MDDAWSMDAPLRRSRRLPSSEPMSPPAAGAKAEDLAPPLPVIACCCRRSRSRSPAPASCSLLLSAAAGPPSPATLCRSWSQSPRTNATRHRLLPSPKLKTPPTTCCWATAAGAPTPTPPAASHYRRRSQNQRPRSPPAAGPPPSSPSFVGPPPPPAVRCVDAPRVVHPGGVPSPTQDACTC